MCCPTKAFYLSFAHWVNQTYLFIWLWSQVSFSHKKMKSGGRLKSHVFTEPKARSEPGLRSGSPWPGVLLGQARAGSSAQALLAGVWKACFSLYWLSYDFLFLREEKLCNNNSTNIYTLFKKKFLFLWYCFVIMEVPLFPPCYYNSVVL